MPAVPFSRLQKEMLALYEPPFRRKSTWFKMRTVLREFSELPSVRKTSDITPIAIAEWLKRHSDRKQVTNQSYLKSFGAACTYAKKMGYLRVAPSEIRSDWFGQLDEDLDDDDGIAVESTKRHHSIQEIVAVLDQADAESLTGAWKEWRTQALIYTYAHTGLRKKEALQLKLADVALEKRIIMIRRRRRRTVKTKSSAAPVGIPDELAVILERWLPRTGCQWVFPGITRKAPWSEGSPGAKPLDMVKSLGSRAGIDGLTILSFRHSISTHCKRFGLGPLELKDLLRHSSIQTQEHYLEKDYPNLRDIARRIDYRRFAGEPPVVSPN